MEDYWIRRLLVYVRADGQKTKIFAYDDHIVPHSSTTHYLKGMLSYFHRFSVSFARAQTIQLR